MIEGYNVGNGDWSLRVYKNKCGIDFSLKDKKMGDNKDIPEFDKCELKTLITDLNEVYEYMDEKKLRISTYYRKCEFDIYHAIMDANLGHYANIVLELLKEGYGFESRDENNKYRVIKKRTTLKPHELQSMLEEGLKLIFKMLNCYKIEIGK
jgi:hypothetical protein